MEQMLKKESLNLIKQIKKRSGAISRVLTAKLQNFQPKQTNHNMLTNNPQLDIPPHYIHDLSVCN